jgi:hypothetical protein
MDNNRPEEGLKTLAKLHAHGDVNNTWVRAEYEQIQGKHSYTRTVPSAHIAKFRFWFELLFRGAATPTPSLHSSMKSVNF